MNHLKKNWHRYLMLGAGAAAAYYGVPPERAQEVLDGLLKLLWEMTP